MSSRDVLGWIVSTFLEKQLFCFKNKKRKTKDHFKKDNFLIKKPSFLIVIAVCYLNVQNE